MAIPSIIRTTPFQGYVSAASFAIPFSAPHTVDSGTGILVVCFYPRTGSGGNFNVKWKVGGSEYPLTPAVSNVGEVAQIHRLIAPIAGTGEILIQHDNTRQKIIQGGAHNVINWTTVLAGAQLSQTGTSISVSCNSALGALVLDCFGLSAVPVTGTITPGSGQTTLFDIQNTTDIYHRAAGSNKVASGASTLMSWSKAATAEMHIAAFAIVGTPGQIVTPDPVVSSFLVPSPTIKKTINPGSTVVLSLVVMPAIVVTRAIEIEYTATMTPDQEMEVNLGS